MSTSRRSFIRLCGLTTGGLLTLPKRSAPSLWRTSKPISSGTSVSFYANNYLNVKDYGAKGDGVTDDTMAFINAINLNRDPNMVAGSGTPKTYRSIYVPPGVYVLSQTIIQWCYTEIVGDPVSPPMLLLAPSSAAFSNVNNPAPFLCSFAGYGILDSDYADWRTPRNNEYANNNFGVVLRNLTIKIGANNPGCYAALHWATAQLSNITNVIIDGTESSSEAMNPWSGQPWNGFSCLFAEQAGAYSVRNCAFLGGANGVLISMENSGYFIRNCTFQGQSFTSVGGSVNSFVGVELIFDQTAPVELINRECAFVLKNCVFKGNYSDPMDDFFWDSINKSMGWTQSCNNYYLENIQFDSLDSAPPHLQPCINSNGLLTSFSNRDVYLDGVCYSGTSSALAAHITTGAYPNPLYPELDNAFVNVLNQGVKGDGTTDDTQAIQSLLNSNKKLFFPSGTYLITGSLFIPDGSVLYGQIGTLITLSQSAPGYDAGANKPWINVGYGTYGVSITQVAFVSHAKSSIVCTWNANENSVVFDSGFYQAGSSADSINLLIPSGGGFFDNTSTGYGTNTNPVSIRSMSSAKIMMFLTDNPSPGQGLVLDGASNFTLVSSILEANPPSNVVISNSSNIELIAAGWSNWAAVDGGFIDVTE